MKCIDCFYFKETDFSSGSCKRFPPVLDVHWQESERGSDYTPSEEDPERWGNPIVLDDDWCGEFKADCTFIEDTP